MKISEKQLQQLMIILKDTLKHNIIGVFSYDVSDRHRLFNEILEQQSTEPIEVE